MAAEQIAKDRMYLSIAMLAEAMVRLGSFYSGKTGLGILSASPIILTVVPNKKYLSELDTSLGAASSEDGARDNLAVPVAADIKSSAGEALTRLIRYHIMRTPISPIGGNYPPRPIGNTGQLAAAIMSLPGHQLRRFSRGRQARTYAHAVSVGLSGGGRPELYGSVLAKVFMSRAPMTSAPEGFFGREAQERFREWGTARGYDLVQTRRIMATVWRRGTYGRSWMAQIAQKISGLNISEFIMTSFRYRIRKILRVK